MSEHIGYAKTKKLHQATGNHLNKPGQSITTMQKNNIGKNKD